MRRKLWGIVPVWVLAVAVIVVAAGTALAYTLTTRDVPVTIREPITVAPANFDNIMLYPGQSVVFTVTNEADVVYGMQYTYTISNPGSGIKVKMALDKDGPGTDHDFVNYIAGRIITIDPNGTHYLKVICTEESAPESAVITMSFSRRIPS